MTIRRLNHAVLYVRDARASAAWFGDVLGFEVVTEAFDGRAVFLRADGSSNDHDLGLFSVGAGAPYKLTTTGTKVTGCKDKSGASVDLNACLKSAAFSAAFKFGSQRVAVDGTSD